jgi:hypothetical protein
MRAGKPVFLMLTIIFQGVGYLKAQNDSLRWTVEATLTYSHFEQQVKSMIGAPPGQKLSSITEFGFWLQGSRRISKVFSAGLYLEYDLGNRTMAQFNGFNSQGQTMVTNALGGTYSEFWTGPFLRFAFKSVFLDAGYGLVGLRNDNSRDDIVSSSGATTGTFSVNPSVAWFAGIGLKAPLGERLSLVVKVQYRFRYYDKRDGDPLMNNIEHGTQNFSPFVGVVYVF